MLVYMCDFGMGDSLFNDVDCFSDFSFEGNVKIVLVGSVVQDNIVLLGIMGFDLMVFLVVCVGGDCCFVVGCNWIVCKDKLLIQVFEVYEVGDYV